MWAGGKTRLLRHYMPYMPTEVSTYIEPFFGGGSMMIYVKQRYNPARIIINDINADIMNIYTAIRDNVDMFCADIDSLEKRYLPLDKPGRRDFYMKLRHHHAYDYKLWSKVREASVLYFLMKTGFNGIYQINKNTNGRYGTPAGLLNQTTQIYDRDTVKWWHTALQGVEIQSVDWRKIQYEPGFLFLDPPYRGSFTSYGQVFNDNDQKELLAFAEQYTGAVFLTNRDIGDGFFNTTTLQQIQIPVTYTAGRRKKTVDGYEAKAATELLLYKGSHEYINR